jgi:hypothetical protein
LGFQLGAGDLPEQIGLPSWSVAITYDLRIKASHNHIVHVDLALPIEGAAGSSWPRAPVLQIANRHIFRLVPETLREVLLK